MVHPFARSEHALLVIAVLMMLANSTMSAQQEQQLTKFIGTCPKRAPGWVCFLAREGAVFAKQIVSNC